jgi:mannose-6-phosphate isomerase-like protein (cupin superfamily)
MLLCPYAKSKLETNVKCLRPILPGTGACRYHQSLYIENDLQPIKYESQEYYNAVEGDEIAMRDTVFSDKYYLTNMRSRLSLMTESSSVDTLVPGMCKLVLYKLLPAEKYMMTNYRITQIIHIVSGMGILTLNQDLFEVGSDTVMVVPAGTKCELINKLSTTELNMYVVLVPPN